MTDDVDSREQGVEFGRLAEELDEESYPISKAELLERYGDRELELADGTTELSAVLDPENEQEFEDAGSVRTTVLNMVGEAAVGEEATTDRGLNSPGTNRSEGDESV